MRYHHHRPSRPKPAESGLVSVTVVCGDGAWADALSTSCCVFGEAGSLALRDTLAAEKNLRIELILVTDDGHVRYTADWRNALSRARREPMSTKPSSPELRPNRYDALVVLIVLALAAALAVRPFLAARAPQSGALTVVVSADGQELDRLPLAQFGTHNYANNGYTLTVTATGGVVSVTQSDCPGQDCVHSGAVSRAGQSIVCLPARIVK